MPSIILDLPEKYRLGHTASLLWVSEDGKKIDSVGLVYVEDGGQLTELFKVNGTPAKAQAVIEAQVVPLWCQFSKPARGRGKPVQPAPVAAVVPEPDGPPAPGFKP